MSGYFALRIPERGRTPVLVEVPHAGLAIPEAVRGEVRVGDEAVRRDADIYVDKLYAGAPEVGASLLTAAVSRYVVDLNRSPDDVDAETVADHPYPRPLQPRGVVWRLTTDGRPTLDRPLTHTELQQRLAAFHTPYHDALRRELEAIRERFGFAILLAAHSMPSVGRLGHLDTGARRADVVPGTRGRTTAHPALIDLVDRHFRSAGLTVRHDEPYRGGWTTSHYGRPHLGWHAIQIELNRALYVDEMTGEPRDGEFERLAALVTDLVEKLGAIDPR
jgi:N-formylglutamate amidohydrolase